MFKYRPGHQEAGGSIELIQGQIINYHFPLEKRSDFSLTRHPAPEWKEQNKYTDYMNEGEKKKKEL